MNENSWKQTCDGSRSKYLGKTVQENGLLEKAPFGYEILKMKRAYGFMKNVYKKMYTYGNIKIRHYNTVIEMEYLCTVLFDER